MTKNLLTIGALMAAFSFAHAQEPDVIPPSPDAASLAKFAEIPVSYNTGTPSISFPLYNITVDDMQIPIAMSYHAGGIKVDEVASWVGIGWTLNAGGAITRVMKGKPDEAVRGYFDQAQWNMWQDMKTWVTGDPQMGMDGPAEQRHKFQYEVATGVRDLQPDIFYFNFGGYSGRIIFDWQMKPVIIPFQDLKITSPFEDNATEWVITTPDGTEYIFRNSDAELTTPMNEGSPQIPFLSSWYLSEVRSVKYPRAITFQYGSTLLAGIETTPMSGVVLRKIEATPNECHSDPPYAQDMGTNTYKINMKHLTAINYSGGTVTFSSTADREDKYQNVNYPGRKLNQISINAYDGSLVKTIDFHYVYRSSRLMLDNLTENRINKYSFEYQGSDMPSPMSFAQDHWGYYNGKNRNTSLLPPMTIGEAAYYQKTSEYTLANADRESTDACLALSLRQINYPTGGKKVFNFEMHVVSGEFDEEKGAEAVALGARLNNSMNLHEQGQYDYFFDQQYTYLGGPIDVRSDEFELKVETDVMFYFNAQITGPGAIGDIAQCHVYKLPIDFNNPVAHNRNGVMRLDPGKYVIIAAASQEGLKISGSVSYLERVPKNLKVGGLRIASIEDYDEGILKSRAEFRYTTNSSFPGPIPDEGGESGEPGGPGFPEGFDPGNLPVVEPISSGELFFYPSYKTKTPCQRLYISASPVGRFSIHQGYHIGYKRVEVMTTSATGANSLDGSNGRVIHIYRNSINDLMRNLEDETIWLTNTGDSVKHVKYRYNFETCFDEGTRCAFSSFAPSITMPLKFHHYTPCFIGGLECATEDFYDFDLQEQALNTFYIYPDKVTEKIFVPGKESPLETFKLTESGHEVIGSYEESHTMPVRTETINSLGEKIVEKFYYSTQEPALEMEIKAPLRHHVLKETSSQDYLLSSTKYDYIENLLTEVLAVETKTPLPFSEGISFSYEPKLNIAYNGNLKVADVLKTDGVNTAYVWDSRNVYPIAEAVNAVSEDVAYTSFENEGNEGGWLFLKSVNIDHHTGMRCHKFSSQSITRQGIQPAKTYRVSFWAKAGTPSVSNVISSSDATSANALGWKYYEKLVSGSSSITISAPAETLIDELRLYPADATMKTYTYRPGFGISTMTDANNISVFYEYDDDGRLRRVSDADKNTVKQYTYQYRQ